MGVHIISMNATSEPHVPSTANMLHRFVDDIYSSGQHVRHPYGSVNRETSHTTGSCVSSKNDATKQVINTPDMSIMTCIVVPLLAGSIPMC
jgi:hypothetical protein